MFLILKMENLYCSNTRNESSSLAVTWPLNPFVSSSKNSFQFDGSRTLNEGDCEERGESASKIHSKAEKRRRDRINAQLATLRKLIPKSDKMDKAALLGSVIEQVKDLKRKAQEISKSYSVPTDMDEVTVDYDHVSQETNGKNIKNNSILIKASLCCDDRPEVFSELNQVLRSSRLIAVKADIASLGGKVKSILVLCAKRNEEESVCLNTLRQSLKLALSTVSSSNYCIRSRRRRLFLPSHYS